MSKPMEQASFSVNIPGKSNPVSQGSQQASKNHPINNDDLSMKHVGVAVGVFAIMVGLFGYGFYVQQQRVTVKESEVKIAEVTTVPKPDASIVLSEASAQAAVHPTSAAVTVKEETITSSGLIESVHADIYFDFGKTRLRADAIEILQQQAQILKQDGHWAVLIQGYTDRHGSVEYNKMLALRRGESVKQFLTELGIPADSMKVVSLGQDAAICDDPTPTCTRLNRRVHLELVKLEARPVSLAPVMPISTVSTQQESETSPTMTSIEPSSDQNNDGNLLTVTPPTEGTQDTTIPPAESH
jgi:outer membrane protein OmpA-like peptidoglycan-associated protein